MTRGWARLLGTLRGLVGRDDRGASFVEYALLVSLIAVVCVAAVTMIGTTTGESLSSTASRLP